MKKVVAALAVCLLVGNGTPALADATNARHTASQPGPLLSASLHANFSSGRPREGRQGQPGEATREQRRSWVGRHPALTGAIVGFGAGCALVYLTADEDAIIAREGPALFFGGVGAGIGALIGWGVSRARDDRPSAGRR